MSRRFRTLAFGVLGTMLVGACVPGPDPADADVVDVIGVIAERVPESDRVVFRLNDGREVVAGTPDVEGKWDTGGGPGDLLLGGLQSGRRWIATLAPRPTAGVAECFALNATGVNRLATISVDGIELPKAAGFESTTPEPAVGEPYAGNGHFCVDRGGRVTHYID